MTYLDKLKKLDVYRSQSKFAERICSELTYLDGISSLNGDKYNGRIEAAADELLARIDKDGVITSDAVFMTEEMLSDLSPVAKSLKEIFVAHSHIDMNWQWGYNETAVITVDTFRTMLTLLKEYPEFTYAQSQASTYEIIEKYCPDMLKEIKKYVDEGRWELTAAEWVEPDKNMPSGESMTRQILEAKKYLSGLFDISSDKICIDFLPDTFGHAVTVPEVLADAGVKYMYHCRGCDEPGFYWYTAPSGKRVLAYREYRWYNGEISTNYFEMVPKFCKQEKIDTYLCVYGVGDHGGGPSRRDIERILEYRSWPLTPDIRFGTYEEFFKIAENSGAEFPVVTEERNFLFEGCYTTQSRIKMANRIAEARIYESEALAAQAALITTEHPYQKQFETPWRNILFSHFHDILPGSGTIETREYALGKFQETLAVLQTSAGASMRKIAEQIDTTGIDFGEESGSTSEGGGTGYGTCEREHFRFPSAERGRGPVRVFHVFNPTAYERDEVTPITVWDYAYDKNQVSIEDDNGNPLAFFLIEDGRNQGNQFYWGHTFRKYMVRLRVPPFGYTTVIVRQKPYEGHMNPAIISYEHTDHTFVNDAPIVMENEKLRAVFDKSTCRLISLTDKLTGEVLIDQPSCFFRLIEENAVYRFIAWRIGPYMKVTDLNAECSVKMTENVSNGLFSRLSYRIDFRRSYLQASITLRQNSSMLDFDVKIDWKEDPIVGKMVPQLSFAVPVSYQTDGYSVSKIPYGMLRRKYAAHDIPSHGILGISGESKHIVSILADSKYGFRAWDDWGQVTLVRNAYDPDPYSDRGIHHICLGVAVSAPDKMNELLEVLSHPLSYVSGTYHDGSLATTETLLRMSGNACVSAVKNSEDNQGTVVRLYDESGKEQHITLKFHRPAKCAYITDTNEKIISKAQICDGKVIVPISPYSVVTVKTEF